MVLQKEPDMKLGITIEPSHSNQYLKVHFATAGSSELESEGRLQTKRFFERQLFLVNDIH